MKTVPQHRSNTGVDHGLQRMCNWIMAAGELPLETLLAPHLDDLRRFVQRRTTPAVRARESCSDLVQSICRELLDRKGRYRGTGFRAWLFATARRKLIDRGRHHTADCRSTNAERQLEAELFERYAATTPSPQRSAEARERLEHVHKAFSALPADYREVLVLARIHRRSASEIARAMGRSVNAIHTLLCRAQARLVVLAGEE
ncbi:MAG: sigma-70 family RNA polymerase sigma factor [Planctomycetota bacterium]|nr:sigma-70 family RNA polymerase sigma factor [Planctomycetota bacterium]